MFKFILRFNLATIMIARFNLSNKASKKYLDKLMSD